MFLLFIIAWCSRSSSDLSNSFPLKFKCLFRSKLALFSNIAFIWCISLPLIIIGFLKYFEDKFECRNSESEGKFYKSYYTEHRRINISNHVLTSIIQKRKLIGINENVFCLFPDYVPWHLLRFCIRNTINFSSVFIFSYHFLRILVFDYIVKTFCFAIDCP